MAKKIILEFTPKELESVIAGIDTLSASTGGGSQEFHDEISRCTKAFDKALAKAGYKRMFD